MLAAGGYAPAYRETRLDDPQMADIRRTMELLLAGHEPFPALDRRLDVAWCNTGYARLIATLTGEAAQVEPRRVLVTPRPNALRLLVGPLRHAVTAGQQPGR